MKLETVLKTPSAPLGCSSHQSGKHSAKSLYLDKDDHVTKTVFCVMMHGESGSLRGKGGRNTEHERPLVRGALNCELESRVVLSPSLTWYWIDGCFLGCHRE